MPASKEFKMTFNMSAKADGSFSSTFSKAQQDLARMQQEIQKLNSTQVDISSYQKQQQAIEATTRKLERLKEQQKLLNKQKEEMRAAGQSTTALEREEKKLEQTVDNTNTKLQQQQQKLTQTGERLRQAGVDTSNLTSESKRLEQEMGQLKNEQEKVAEGAQRSGQAMAEAFDAAASAMAAAGIVAGLKQIYDAFAECVNVAAEFESTMSTVEALSGASGGEMEELSAKAKELGATTVFTAQEAGDAMTYMGMAGWKAQDMISGMDGVLNLAAASGEDLAMVSDIVTDNLTAFGLKASDTSRFADVLAAAATNSNTSVSIMGETFKQSAAIAGALGYSVEDVAVAVGLMANAGIKGSIAGTALKNTFNGLLEGATLSGEALGEYEFTALQADGTMKGFKDTLDELRGAFSQMSDAEKVQNAMLIAGKRGYNGLLAILNATEEDYNKLTSAINDSAGAAERMAQIKLDNLKGDLALANSAAEAFKDSVGSALIPVLRQMVQAGTEAMSAIAGFTEEHQSAVAAVAGLAAGIATAVVAVTALSAAIKVFKALNLAAMFASPVGQIMMAAGAIAGLVLAVNAADAAMKANRGEVYQLTAASQKQYFEVQKATAAYNKAMEGKFQDTAATIALRARMDELTEAYEANKQTLADWQAENQSILDSVQELRDGFQESSNSFSEQNAEVEALSYRLDQLAGKSNRTAAEQQQMLSIVDRLNNSVPGLNLYYDQQTGKLNQNTAAIKNMAKAQARQRYEEEKQEYYTDLYAQQLRLEEQRTEAKENLAAAQERLNAMEGNSGHGNNLADPKAHQEAAEAVRLYTQEFEALDSELASVTAELGGYEAELAGTASASQSVEAATQSIQSALSTLSTSYVEAYASARESLEGQFSLWEKAAEVSATSLSTLQENIQSQIDYWNNYNTNLDTVKQAADAAGIDLSGIWGHLTDGSADAVNAVAGIASAISQSSSEGTAALSDYVTSYGELQEAMGSTAETIASGAEGVQNALDGVQQAVEAGAQNLEMPDEFRAAMETNMNALTEAFSSGEGVAEALAGFQDQVTAQLSGMDLTAEAQAAGENVGKGLAQGVTSSAGEAASAATDMGTQTIDAAKSALGEASPSVYMQEAGVNLNVGLANGITESSSQPVSAIEAVGTQVVEAFMSAIQGIADGVGEASGLGTAFAGIAESISAQAEALDLSEVTRAAGEATASGYQEGLSAIEGTGGGLEALRGQAAAAVEGLNLSAEANAAGLATVTGYQTGLSSGVGVSLGALRGQAAAAVASLNLSGEASAAGAATMMGYQTGLAAGGGPGPAMEAAKAMAMAGVQGLNLSAEATVSGTATMQGFAAGVTGATGLATSAMHAAAQASINAFRSAMSPGPFQAAARAAMQGAVNGVRAGQAALVAAARAAGQAAAAAFKAAQGSIGGLATGTRSADPGLTWVGEQGPELVYAKNAPNGNAALPPGATLVGTHGPELMYMQGGETVIPAPQTQTILSRYQREQATIQAYAEGTDSAQRGLAMVGEQGPEIVTVLPQAMGMMAAWQKNKAKTRPDRYQAERMGRIMDSVRNYDTQEPEDGQGTGAPVQFVINIYGSPPPETVDRLEDFIYSDSFSERVNEVVGQAQRDAARRAYR